MCDTQKLPGENVNLLTVHPWPNLLFPKRSGSTEQEVLNPANEATLGSILFPSRFCPVDSSHSIASGDLTTSQTQNMDHMTELVLISNY